MFDLKLLANVAAVGWTIYLLLKILSVIMSWVHFRDKIKPIYLEIKMLKLYLKMHIEELL